MSMNPLISIIVPNYNHSKYLPERIESLINQTYKNFELIILDDASTDNSLEIIEGFTHRLDFVKVYNKTNSGSTFLQWQKGLLYSKGEFIWIAESDDSSLPTFLEKCVEKMIHDNSLGLVYTNTKVIDSKSEYIGDYNSSYKPVNIAWNSNYKHLGTSEVKNFFLNVNSIPNVSSILFKKDALVSSLENLPYFKLCGDWYIYVSILMKYNIYFISETLNLYRKHTGTVRQRTMELPVGMFESIEIIKYIFKKFKPDFFQKCKSYFSIFKRWGLYIHSLSIQNNWLILKKIFLLDPIVFILTCYGFFFTIKVSFTTLHPGIKNKI